MFGGYPPTAISYPPTAISYPPAAIIGRIGHSEFFFFILWQPLRKIRMVLLISKPDIMAQAFTSCAVVQW